MNDFYRLSKDDEIDIMTYCNIKKDNLWHAVIHDGKIYKIKYTYSYNN